MEQQQDGIFKWYFCLNKQEYMVRLIVYVQVSLILPKTSVTNHHIKTMLNHLKGIMFNQAFNWTNLPIVASNIDYLKTHSNKMALLPMLLLLLCCKISEMAIIQMLLWIKVCFFFNEFHNKWTKNTAAIEIELS